MTESKTRNQAMQDWGHALLLAIAVFVSRYLTRGALYYVDGPNLVQCIQNHTYVIQPPGYWLFARMGGLFANPAFGLQFLNQMFSAFGVAVFFLLCRKLNLDRTMSWAASACYASVFFVWIAGDIHSAYASQIFAAPLLVYLFLSYRDRASIPRLLACAACFAFGAGLRPSDGLFLAPLFVFLALHFVAGWPRRSLLAACSAAFCLAWYLPYKAAERAAHIMQFQTYIQMVRRTSLLLSGIHATTLANLLRVALPLVVAFWLLLPALAFKREKFANHMLAIWIIPGTLFFSLVYMADPVYFCYLAAAIVLIAALSRPRHPAWVLLVLCAVFNLSLFFFAQPIRGASRSDEVVNFYIVKYCDYGVRHQWATTITNSGVVP